MSITDRDRKILIIIVPLLAVLAYWFLLFAPKREEAAGAADELAKQEQRRDSAVEQARGLDSMKTDFAAEYAELVKLGKAIPSSVDMPSLLVQLDQAARGTGIKFKRVAAGQRQAAAPAPAQKGAGAASTPAAAGGTPAKSAPGKGAESAGNASAETQTSTTAKQGALPVGGGAATPGAAGAGGASSGVPGLDSVPLDFEFEGSFFELADLFHRLKRFVQVANQRVLVRGRLLTIDSVSFSSGQARFPKLKAEITATVYLAPKAEGATAGATPQGPASTTPAGGSSPPASPQGAQPAGATTPSATSAPSKP